MNGPFEFHFQWWFTMAAVAAFNVPLLLVWFVVLRWAGLAWVALATVGIILAACVVALGMPPADAGYELAGFGALSGLAHRVMIRRRERAGTKGGGPGDALQPRGTDPHP